MMNISLLIFANRPKFSKVILFCVSNKIFRVSIVFAFLLIMIFPSNAREKIKLERNPDYFTLYRYKIYGSLPAESETTLIKIAGEKFIVGYSHSITGSPSYHKEFIKRLEINKMKINKIFRYDKVIINILNELNIMELSDLIGDSQLSGPDEDVDVVFILTYKKKNKIIRKEITSQQLERAVSGGNNSENYRLFLLSTFIDRILQRTLDVKYYKWD